VSSDSELGSKEYDAHPKAIVCGGGYDREGVEGMVASCKGLKGVAWLRVSDF
jgi:hypothetical protein